MCSQPASESGQGKDTVPAEAEEAAEALVSLKEDCPSQHEDQTSEVPAVNKKRPRSRSDNQHTALICVECWQPKRQFLRPRKAVTGYDLTTHTFCLDCARASGIRDAEGWRPNHKVRNKPINLNSLSSTCV